MTRHRPLITMASETVDTPRPAPPRGTSSAARRLRAWLATWSLLSPGLLLLLLFFAAPLFVIYQFSVAERMFSRNAALASLNGEFTSYSTAIWSKFLSHDVTLQLAGGASLSLSLVVLGIAELALLLLAVWGARLVPRGGGIVASVAALLLVLPYLALPWGETFPRLAELTSEGTDVRLFFKSITLSMTASLFALVIAFPVAYWLAHVARARKYIWLVIVITPFLTSYLLRIFAWRLILSNDGPVQDLLATLGITDQPIQWLLDSQFTVVIVLAYAWVPFICLPIFIALENQDTRLLEAATDLGASRFTAFRKITLPLAAPGVIAAFLFVFIPTIGEVITPSLVGGSSGYMFGNRIYGDFISSGSFDWQTGSALSLFLLGVVIVITASTVRFLRGAGGEVA